MCRGVAIQSIAVCDQSTHQNLAHLPMAVRCVINEPRLGILSLLKGTAMGSWLFALRPRKTWSWLVNIDEKAVVLVVDDQTTVLKVMGRMLSENYVVHVATTGERAVEIAEEKVPDLILLDMVMPQMSGIDVCLRLKQNPVTQHIPVIFVTGMDDHHNEARGFKAGAVDYITKPPSPEIVHARVAVHLALNRQTRFLGRLARGEINDLEEIRATAKSVLDAL